MGRRVLSAALAVTLSGLAAVPATATTHDRVDSLAGVAGLAAPAPANVETAAFGEAGWSGRAIPTPEPEPVVAAAPEPVVTAESRTEAAPTRDAVREPAPEPSPVEPAAPAPTPEPEPAPEPAPAPPAGGGVLGIAASLVGTPYVYGDTGPGGFDCSGYTSYVFAQVGVSLPRTAAAQQSYATPVSNPQPGDLVFWGYPAYHVGIYAGHGMVYDSGNPGTGVIYRSVFSGISGYGRVL